MSWDSDKIKAMRRTRVQKWAGYMNTCKRNNVVDGKDHKPPPDIEHSTITGGLKVGKPKKDRRLAELAVQIRQDQTRRRDVPITLPRVSFLEKP